MIKNTLRKLEIKVNFLNLKIIISKANNKHDINCDMKFFFEIRNETKMPNNEFHIGEWYFSSKGFGQSLKCFIHILQYMQT